MLLPAYHPGLFCLDTVQRGMESIDQNIEKAMGAAAYGIDTALSSTGRALSKAGKNAAAFIKKYWPQLIAYIVAWGLIVTCTGLLYGFKAVALPLTIGIGCGLAFGVIVGILTTKSFDKKGKYSLWNILDGLINRVKDPGTRQIVSSVAVTVILAAAVVFPHALGAIFGILIANQLAVQACIFKPPPPLPQLEGEEEEDEFTQTDLDQTQPGDLTQPIEIEFDAQEEIKQLREELKELKKLALPIPINGHSNAENIFFDD